MNFKKINNIVGWAVFFIAAVVYISTSEAGGSFWDCGEFVSSAYKVQIPHPPGAPLFVLLGRFFIILFGDNPLNAAKAVNTMNALASAFTILFLFWTITHFARRIVNGSKSFAEMSGNQIWTIMGAGAIGALAFTFSDSFWYSAVEGEVYALSAFFTAITFWAILRWEHMADKPGADKWIIFIFFLMGLAIGVHLLNLLTIPAIILVIYFRRRHEFNYTKIRTWFLRLMIAGGILGFLFMLIGAPAVEYSSSEGIGTDATPAGLILFLTAVAIGAFYLIEKNSRPEKKELYGGAYIFLVLSAVILGIVQVGIIQYSIKLAGAADRIFVNSFGLPFFTGFTFLFVIIVVALYLGIKYANKRGFKYLSLGLWSAAFILIGYSTYLTTLIRSNANPSIDMFNVDNPMSLVGYLGREQYGDWPLLYGQKFTAERPNYIDVGTNYAKSTDIDPNAKAEYIVTGKKQKAVYDKKDKMIFPRVWNNGNDRRQADYYASFLGIGKYQDPQTGGTRWERQPNLIDNIKFFIGYQNYYMFMRYFLWNYSGRQNDLQGSGGGDVRGGNWITGISFIDNMMYGDQSAMPESLKHNKAHNRFFLLPLILGLLGMFFHFKKKGDDAFITFMLFFMTGFAIILYLNQAGNEPRERDYAFAGATYAFAVWIGIGVFKVREWFEKISKPLATSLAFVVCMLAVPVLMAQQGWDDHNRAKKTLAPDLAIDYLESCAPNAILFSFGDNDTYPLWYAQEVLGIRKDIRVVNTSLLGIDWYINGLRNKVNESAPIDVIFNRQQMEGDRRNVVYYNPNPAFPETQYYNLYDMMKDYVGVDNPATMVTAQDGTQYNTFPVKKVFVPVDEKLVRGNGTVNVSDTVLEAMNFDIPKNYLAKNDWAVLNIIAANQWKRPIYFTSGSSYQIGLGFENYLRKEGLSYRLTPVRLQQSEMSEAINTEKAYPVMMNKFRFGNADLPGVYFDEENRRHLVSIRTAYAQLALELIAEGKKEEAIKTLHKVDKGMLQENMPYGMVSSNNAHNQASFFLLQAAALVGEKQLFNKISASLKKDLAQQINYVNVLGADKVGPYVTSDASRSQQLLQFIDQLEKEVNSPGAAAGMETQLNKESDSIADSIAK